MFLFCGLLHLIANAPAAADQPAGVVRTFAVLVNGGPEFAPDFLGENSSAVVVNGAQSEDDFHFAASELDPLFQQPTTWELRDAIHIVRCEGIDEILGVFAWLRTNNQEPPPAGAITFTGFDSPLILDVRGYWFENDIGGGGLRIRATPGGAGYMVIVTAVFSR
jgi:hypothetical protein